jgi:hypothetical protein
LFILACSELEDVREHDRRVTEEAETAQRDVRIIFSLSFSINNLSTSSNLKYNKPYILLLILLYDD